jgi:ribokinase
MSNRPARIAVLGSLNVDRTYRVPRIPSPGETVASRGVMESFGGKGANQAVAARRAGAQVDLIGCIGADEAGRRYQEGLLAEGIGATAIRIVPDFPTGSAVIFVDDHGENSIVVEAGANQAVDENWVEACREIIVRADVLLMQLECPMPAVRRASALAMAAGTTVVLNPSPWTRGFPESGIRFHHLIVNETEAAALLGRSPDDLEALPVDLARPPDLRSLVITRGSAATLVHAEDGVRFALRPPSVVPVDTVGAGDSFAGAFVVALAEGLDLEEAVRFANAAGALATLQPGAQTAIPRREEIRRRAELDRS